MKIRKILVPMDFSECATRALDYATSFAEVFHASVVVLHVVEPAVGSDNYMLAGPALADTNEQLLDTGRERLTQLCHKRIGNRVTSDALVRMGRAASEIADTCRALGVDLVIMGTHGHTGIKHALLGSTAEKVVRHAECPVLTVRHSNPDA